MRTGGGGWGGWGESGNIGEKWGKSEENRGEIGGKSEENRSPDGRCAREAVRAPAVCRERERESVNLKVITVSTSRQYQPGPIDCGNCHELWWVLSQRAATPS